MKNGLLAVVVAVVCGGTAWAEVYEGNPDKMPSIGISAGSGSESGDSKAFGGGASASQDIDLSNRHLALDIRLPVSDSVTLSAAVASTQSKVSFQETPLLFGNNTKTDGYSFDVGVRFYIH